MERAIRRSDGLFVALAVNGKNGNVLSETSVGRVLHLTRHEFVSTVSATLDQ